MESYYISIENTNEEQELANISVKVQVNTVNTVPLYAIQLTAAMND